MTNLKEALREQLKAEAALDVSGEIERSQREYLRNPSAGNKFSYSCILTKSSDLDDVRRGTIMLNELWLNKDVNERDALYYLAVGNYKLSELLEAKKFADRLVAQDPESAQGVALRELIMERLNKDGAIGLAIMGGLAIAAGLVARVALRSFSKKS
eukprot:tig00021720_g23179.t1